MRWLWWHGSGSPDGVAKMSLNSSSSTTMRSEAAMVWVVVVRCMVMPYHMTRWSSHQQDIRARSKSHKIDPSVCSHWTPRTIS
jgi:hypothetical protein